MDYRKDIIGKIRLFWGNRVYNNSFDCAVGIQKRIKSSPLDKYLVLAFRILVRYLENHGLKSEYAIDLRKSLKNRKSNPDMFVPSNEQVFSTLERLGSRNRLLFCLYLCSGVRKNEGEYVYQNLNKLKIQEGNGYVKIALGTYRKTKTAYFCYVPDWLYGLLKERGNALSVRSLDNLTTTKKLVAAKYCRKWFYTKCVELGVPESIADFYEGRVSTTIGANHYLAKQSLADKYYGEILSGYLVIFKKVLEVEL